MLAATVALGAFITVVGVCHAVVPRYFESLVPPWVPAGRAVVLATGAAEVVLGVGVLVPATRGPAAWATAALFSGYVATHVDALVRSLRRPAPRWLDRTPAAVVRVVVNVAYVGWAAAVAVSR